MHSKVIQQHSHTVMERVKGATVCQLTCENISTEVQELHAGEVGVAQRQRALESILANIQVGQLQHLCKLFRQRSCMSGTKLLSMVSHQGAGLFNPSVTGEEQLLPKLTSQHVAGAEEEGEVGDAREGGRYGACSHVANFAEHHVTPPVHPGAYGSLDGDMQATLASCESRSNSGTKGLFCSSSDEC